MIYADNAATTPVSPEVAAVVNDYMLHWFGNPSSPHMAGRIAKEAIYNTERIVRKYFDAAKYGVVFTSGATESDNMAINFAIKADEDSGRRNIVISAFEHPAVREACIHAKKYGFTVTEVYPKRNGIVDPEDVAREIKKDTVLVSIMAVNNELGTKQPIAEIGRICKKNGVYFHTDATQGLTKNGFDVRWSGVDIVSCTAHKIYGPKGVGLFLYNGEIKNMPSIMYGGHQQNSLRPGTENVPGIAGFGAALNALKNEGMSMGGLVAKGSFVEMLRKWTHPHSFNAGSDLTNSGIVSLRVEGFKGADLALLLSVTKDVYVSSGSACSSGSGEASRSLKAIGLSDKEASETIRVSFGKYNTAEDGEKVARAIMSLVEDMRH